MEEEKRVGMEIRDVEPEDEEESGEHKFVAAALCGGSKAFSGAPEEGKVKFTIDGYDFKDEHVGTMVRIIGDGTVFHVHHLPSGIIHIYYCGNISHIDKE